jgi:hypothetical protein
MYSYIHIFPSFQIQILSCPLGSCPLGSCPLLPLSHLSPSHLEMALMNVSRLERALQATNSAGQESLAGNMSRSELSKANQHLTKPLTFDHRYP